MTYFGVLLRFIGPPLLILAAVTIYDLRRGSRVAPQFHTWPAWTILVGHIAIALIYTTPWDNYLVANRVWWYEPTLVTGIVFGWVPIEEYTFFVVQTLMTGLWLWVCLRRARLPQTAFAPNRTIRWATAGVGSLIWVVWLVLLLVGWTRGRYMALLIVWFLPPILLQLGFGADILWHHRRLVFTGLVPPFVYLCIVDTIAIHSGTWTINPDNTVGWDLGGILPLEEVTFFLVTNVLIAFGIVLMLARESHVRARTPVGKALASNVST